MGLQQSKLLGPHRSLVHMVFELESLHTPGALYASPPAPLIRMRPAWLLRSWIEPTARPLAFTNSGMTTFMRAPESTRTIVNRLSMIAVPILAG